MTQLTPGAVTKRKQAAVLLKTLDEFCFFSFSCSTFSLVACIGSDLGQGGCVFVSAADVDDFLGPKEFNVTGDGTV